MSGQVVPLSGGQSEGTVSSRVRMNSGDPKGAADRKSSAPRKPRAPRKPSDLMTIQDVADHTRASYWTARGWIESGKLPVLRLPGRLIRIRPAALERFLETECR
jgi:excisionase family DNA binding protein